VATGSFFLSFWHIRFWAGPHISPIGSPSAYCMHTGLMVSRALANCRCAPLRRERLRASFLVSGACICSQPWRSPSTQACMAMAYDPSTHITIYPIHSLDPSSPIHRFMSSIISASESSSLPASWDEFMPRIICFTSSCIVFYHFIFFFLPARICGC
jgi:hypothetical protein